MHEIEMVAKRRKNENFQLITENDVESDLDNEDGEADAKTLKFLKDLEDIKTKKAQQAELMITVPKKEDEELRKREDKELKKLMKEKDKLERDAMVARMLEKDREAADKNKMSGVVENPGLKGVNEGDKAKYIPELRKISRGKYLETREEQQLDLFKRRLMDEQRIFGD